MARRSFPVAKLVVLTLLISNCKREPEDVTWPMYSADPSGSKYSEMTQINRENITDLKVAWTYASGDNTTRSTIECNPIIVDGIVYITTPSLHLVALDAESGQEIWVFDEGDGGGVNRGVVIWEEKKRVYYAKGHFLYALDALEGGLITTFGQNGAVDLKVGLDRNVAHLRVQAATPGIIYKDKIIQGTSLGEGPGPAAPGHIRAYDLETGKLEWTFRTIPHPGEFGYETWSQDSYTWAGGTNAWGGFTLDEERAIVFCGTGSATYDHYGGNRIGENLFANCILALDAKTGKRIWHYQVVHHDIWDYDIPCPPNLVQVMRDGVLVDAVAQPTKMGHLFVLARETGEPLFPIEEVPVPQSAIPDEVTWPTQPFPIKGLRYADQRFTSDNVTNVSPESADSVLKRLGEMITGDIFIPPGLRPSVMLPQFNGGTDWGGAAYDPVNRKLIVNCSNEAEWISMVPSKPNNEISQFDFGKNLFGTYCTSCHSLSVSENPLFATLTDLRKSVEEKSDAEVLDQIVNGKNQMPAHNNLSNDEKDALIAFLRDVGHKTILDKDEIRLSISGEIPYVATGHNEFKDPEGFPVNQPPWGMLTSIDLDKGEIDWQVPLGTYPELEERGLPPTGTFNMGGPLLTKSGLVFIGGAMDERLHVYDASSGELLWEYQLDAGGYATPSTYMIDGKQYVIIAAGGGGKPGTKSGDKYYCFSL